MLGGETRVAQSPLPLRLRLYGSPRIVRHLFDTGFAWRENRVATLKKANGIKARHMHRRAPERFDSLAHTIAPNLLDLKFEPTGLNQK